MPCFVSFGENIGEVSDVLNALQLIVGEVIASLTPSGVLGKTLTSYRVSLYPAVQMDSDDQW